MSGFFDPFGGKSLKAAEVSYREVVLATTAPLVLQWPAYADDESYCARSMNIITAVLGANVTLPDASQASPGEQIIWYNTSANSVQINSASGVPITSVEPGGRRLLELVDNGTPSGFWIVTLLGVGTGTLDIAGAAGAGLKAIGTTLNVAFPVVTVAASRAVVEGDRDTVLVWTGGTGSLTLPNAASVSDLNFEVRNQGTGALTIAPTGGQLIDGASSIVLNNGESCWVHVGGTEWYTVGRGRNAQFNFTQLSKNVAPGGTVVLSLTEAANVVQTYTGLLTSNVEIVLPPIVQVYYVSNQTSGAFSLTLRNPGVGSTVPLPQGQNAVVFSDGTNVINASTTIAGISQVTFGAGTAANPSVAIGATTTGFYSPSSGQVAFSSNGTQSFLMTATGAVAQLATGNAVLGVTATAGTAFVDIRRPAGSQAGVMIRSGGSPRIVWGTDGAAESGGNAGTNAVLQMYDDAGVLLSTPVTINRATGIATFAGGVRDLSDLGSITTFLSDQVTHAGYLPLNGALVSRTTYADLWAYAQTTTPVSEAAWSGGLQGRFSVGDGVNTFRLPDLRGTHIRVLDSGRGLDAGRTWGSYQADALLTHNHGVNDPTHAHSVSDPGHTHSGGTLGAGSHSHGVSDPGHSHGRGEFNGINLIGGSSGAYVRLNNGTPSVSTDVSGTGIGIFGVGDHAHTLSINGAGTGIGIFGSGTGISIQSAGSASEARVKNYAYPAYVRY